ncbi:MULTISPECIES: mechanosensitive ion channel family protein [Halorussus]|uniref:mechanosensitive ion channel family protein n=1 Tax=Halorussus TaxID=1070314 RepID=UPI000E20DFF4|nr:MULTISPECIES: mechanosensitive ion channel family protein [Halorussus]NHN59101.1 mechanosensitive ion channel family protein [Halorussus sp. JP-T4]
MVGLQSVVEEALRLLRNLPGVSYVRATVILVVAWFGSQLLIRFLGRPVARRFQRPSLTKTILGGLRAIVMVIAASVAANQFGFKPGDILLSVTVFSAVLGLVLAPIIGSVINGLFLLADQPYEIGDMIELVDRGRRGYVEDITLRYTKIFTLENTFLVIPNSNMRDRDVINYSAEDTRSRLSLELLVTYEGDLDEARAIMERAARETTEVVEGGPDIRIGSARYPSAPVSYIKDFADHGVLLDLRYWVKDPYYVGRVESKIQERVWSELDGADVEIAYPHQHLVFDETSGTARVEIERGEPAAGPEEFDAPD